MSEKEIRDSEVSGKTLEDLTEEELKQVQGQGDTADETAAVTPNIFAQLSFKKFCKK